VARLQLPPQQGGDHLVGDLLQHLLQRVAPLEIEPFREQVLEMLARLRDAARGLDLGVAQDVAPLQQLRQGEHFLLDGLDRIEVGQVELARQAHAVEHVEVGLVALEDLDLPRRHQGDEDDVHQRLVQAVG